MSVCTIATKGNKVQQFLTLMEEPEVQSVLKLFIDNAIATSELNILKRLADIEQTLGLNGFSDFKDEDHELTIPEQLSLLAERIDDITEPVNIQDPIKPVVNTNPKTTLEHKACQLVDHIKTNVKPRNGEVFLNSREIIYVLKHEIPEEYRMNDIQNPRQAKKDVIEKAQKMFPDCIFISKAKHGTKEVRIIYKPYALHPYIRTIQNKQA